METDHYKTLGIAESASSEDIRRAYRILARRYHPDINRSADSGARFSEINKAYETLSDGARKEAYDNMLLQGNRGASSRSSTFSDGLVAIGRAIDRFIDRVFDALNPGIRKLSFAEMQITVGEALEGVTKSIEIDGKQVAVRVAPWTYDGAVVRLRSRTHRGHELVVVVHHRPARSARLERRGLVIDLPLSIVDAYKGVSQLSYSFESYTGTCTIPAGSQSGDEIRVKHKDNQNQDRDIFCRLVIKAPPQASGLNDKIEALVPYYGNRS